MHHRVLPDIATRTDSDRLGVAADRRPKPDVNGALDSHVADHDRIRCNPVSVVILELRYAPTECVKRNRLSFLQKSRANYEATVRMESATHLLTYHLTMHAQRWPDIGSQSTGAKCGLDAGKSDARIKIRAVCDPREIR